MVAGAPAHLAGRRRSSAWLRLALPGWAPRLPGWLHGWLRSAGEQAAWLAAQLLALPRLWVPQELLQQEIVDETDQYVDK